MEKNKKGQLGGLTIAMLTLIVAGIILVMGLLLLGGFNNVTDNYIGVTNNETGWINSSGYTLASASFTGFNNPVISSVQNQSQGFDIPSANYTLVGNVVYNSTARTYTGANFTYGYQYGQTAFSASNKSIVGVSNFSDFWSIIVLSIVISIIIGILLVTFTSKKVK